MIERIIIGVVVAAAALWAVRRLWRNWRRGRCGGCADRDHCPQGNTDSERNGK